MQETLKLDAEIREDTGKSAARAIRKQGRIPGIVYGDGKEVKISLEHKPLALAYSKGGFRSKVVELNTGKEVLRVLPREVQLHPVTDRPLHVDFLKIPEDKKVKVRVKVQFINREKSPGIKRGGILNIVRRTVELLCDANNIPEILIADLEGLQIRDSVHFSSLEVPEGVTPVIDDRDFTIATIAGRIKKEEVEAAPVAEGAEAEAEGDSEGEGAEEGEQSEE